MGLDTVELVMDVEDKFDIVIWDADYPGLATVGDMHALIIQRLQASLDPRPEPPPCPSTMTFLKVRQFFATTFDIGRPMISPKTPLETLLPRSNREASWFDLARHAELQLPRLQRTLPQILGVFFMPLGLCGVPTLLAIEADEPGIVVLTAGCGLICYLILSALLASRIPPSLLPVGCEVVGDLVKFVRVPKYASETVTTRYASTTKMIDRDAVWRDLVPLICDQLAVKEDQVKPESRFVEDLGCG